MDVFFLFFLLVLVLNTLDACVCAQCESLRDVWRTCAVESDVSLSERAGCGKMRRYRQDMGHSHRNCDAAFRFKWNEVYLTYIYTYASRQIQSYCAENLKNITDDSLNFEPLFMKNVCWNQRIEHDIGCLLKLNSFTRWTYSDIQTMTWPWRVLSGLTEASLAKMSNS